MSDKLTARRGSQDDNWRWEDSPGTPPKPAGRRGRAMPITVLAALGLAAAAAVAVAAVALLQDDGDGNSAAVSIPSHTPATTLIPPAMSTPRPTQPATPAATLLSTASTPQGNPALAWWSDQHGSWFGDLTAEAASISEGDYVPFLLRWNASPGQTFEIGLTYDCDGIDYLSGLQSGSAPLLAPNGPGRERPDSGAPVPDTPGLAEDDGNTGVLLLFGGRFILLPQPPQPAGACTGRRTITLPVEATGDTVILVGSVHIAAGSASGQSPFAIEASVSGVGTAHVSIEPAR